jgi:single-strand DNA-binding protein
MANETPLTIVGNLTADPDLRFTPSGVAVANVTVASTPSRFDRDKGEYVDEETTFMRCNVWREQAENVAESLKRGLRVIVVGRLRTRSFETKEGEKRTVMELDVDDIGPALRRATAEVTKNPPKGSVPHPAEREQSSGWAGSEPTWGAEHQPREQQTELWPDATTSQEEPPF